MPDLPRLLAVFIIALIAAWVFAITTYFITTLLLLLCAISLRLEMENRA